MARDWGHETRLSKNFCRWQFYYNDTTKPVCLYTKTRKIFFFFQEGVRFPFFPFHHPLPPLFRKSASFFPSIPISIWILKITNPNRSRVFRGGKGFKFYGESEKLELTNQIEKLFKCNHCSATVNIGKTLSRFWVFPMVGLDVRLEGCGSG